MLRVTGLALFLPVPIVLALFTQAPLGLLPSFGLGILLMLTHRPYARPLALRHASRRCLWCGRETGGPELTVREPLGTTVWRACESHGAPLLGTLGWAERHALMLKLGILGTLVLFLLAAPLAAAGRLGPLTQGDAVAFFRVGIALTVLPLGLLGPRAARPSEPPAPPFPLHIQALIGTWAVLWLFRLVGLVWLALGVMHVFNR